jgi:hypothetical protein
VRRGERVGHAELGEDDDGAVDGGAEPGDVRVPPQRAALPGDGELVDVGLARLDRALRDVRWPVRPARLQLPDAVPAGDSDGVSKEWGNLAEKEERTASCRNGCELGDGGAY